MNSKDFLADAPGRIVASSAYEIRILDGVRGTIPVPTPAFLPDSLPPRLDWPRVLGRITPELIDAERALARLEGRARGVLEPRILMGPFWRREARLSSLIEDTVTTPERLAVAEVNPEASESETREVFNYLAALRHGRESNLPICGRLIREMHAILLTGVRGEQDLPGKYRTEQNYIGSGALGVARARFVPPPPSEVERSMADFESFLNLTPRPLPELVIIPLAHYQFECIHPFRDGNGRLGRLLILLSLCRGEVLSQPWIYISDYLERNRDTYRDLLLRVSTHGDWEAWLRFMLIGFAESARSASESVERILALRDELRGRVTSPRSSALLLTMVDRLFERPVINVKQAMELLGVSHTAVRGHLKRLVDLGILEEIVGGGRQQYWLARSILDASDAPGQSQ
ncbi:MAG: Fic family protein [Planctomycetaceae bacterium]|nr:Fic family protein [Planctomycetaceae bacterium]